MTALVSYSLTLKAFLVFLPQQQPTLFRGNTPLPVLMTVDLALTADRVFAWLRMS
jgi:hypothetical protein